MHGNAYIRSVINDDKVWFEILKEFMEENAKGFADTMDFFNKVSEKLDRITGILQNNIFTLQINLF